MNTPEQLKYSEEHEWAEVKENNVIRVGITDFAQGELGDIVFVELPKVGTIVKFGDPFGSVESVKTVSELYSPVTGKIVAINNQLTESPEKVNEAPYGSGWMVEIEMSSPSELDQLWSAEKYVATYGA